jgi:hypothetical protein
MLLLHPERELGALCHWLGVAVSVNDLQDMQHPERGRFAFMGPPAAPWGADAGFLTSPTLRRPNLPRLSDLQVGLRVRDAVVDVAAELGYQ